jgi:Glucose-6-phosphate dehydrogenase, NAD binding domain
MKTSTISRPADSCAFVIFGGNGDLAWRKLVPSLFNLHINKSLPAKRAIIAVDRADINDAALRKRLRVGVKKIARAGKPQDWRNFEAHLSYCRGDFENSKTYIELARRLAKLDKDWSAKATHIFHLAVPPSLFAEIPKMLAKTDIAVATTTTPVRCATWCRIICCNCSASLRWKRRCPLVPTRSATKKSMCFTRSARLRLTKSINVPCAANMAREKWAASKSAHIAMNREWHVIRTRRLSRRWNCLWTTGGGTACRFICEPASGCR